MSQYSIDPRKKAEKSVFKEDREDELNSGKNKKSVPKYTLEEFYGLAQKGVQSLGLPLNLEDKEQRDRLVAKRESAEMPFNYGLFSSIIRVLLFIVALPMVLVMGNKNPNFLPSRIKIREGLPVTMPLPSKNGELNNRGSIKLEGNLECGVRKEDVSFSVGNSPTTYFEKILLGGKELNFASLREQFHNEYSGDLDDSKILSMFADLAMLGASNEQTPGRDLLIEKIKNYHGEVLFPKEDERTVAAKKQENLQQSPMEQAVSLPVPEEMQDMDTVLVMGETKKEEDDGLLDIFEEVAAKNRQQGSSRPETSYRSEASDSQNQGMRM